MSLQDDLQECQSFTACVIQKKQDFDSFLAAIEEQKIQDWLLGASEIAHSYNLKLLIMADQEKSTNDRAYQEYSMDPHYSVIVSKECLYNVSCLPEADSYTVVKIFGTISEEGQTVSGLSGSSLAELMLKPSLEAVPVFSIDGNTTTGFQHDFVRVFMVHSIKAVLETNHENHQIYQVMTQLDSVSGYRIPQRPVDHFTQYDHQQIIIMEDDHIVRTTATYLYEKHPMVSSVYILDENQRLKLINGASVPLSEDSRLVLVGHGTRDNSGEMRLAGYRAQDVANIIQQTSRIGNKIKTTSLVACEVGSDSAFIKTLLRELHDTFNIETKLHLRDTVLQVRHTGEKITLEITKEGLQWQHKDGSKKVVGILDRNGDVIIRNEPGRKGEAVFTDERNFLMDKTRGKQRKRKRPDEPQTFLDEPQRFIDERVFGAFKEDEPLTQIRAACDELEALSWGFFHRDLPGLEKISTNNLQITQEQYLIMETTDDTMKRIVHEQEIKRVLGECYEIKSSKDIRNVIQYFAETKDTKTTYLMINDWILAVNHKDLYVTLVGKKLNSNRRESEKEIIKCITEQKGKERYEDMRNGIRRNFKTSFSQYVKDMFVGERTTPSTGAWCTTYLTASIISESARNFRTFPLVLMALDILERSDDKTIRTKAQNFFWEDHPMARGGSWFNRNERGFRGAASQNPKGRSWEKLVMVIKKEFELYQLWATMNNNGKGDPILEMITKFKLTESNSVEENPFVNNYKTFKTTLEHQDNSRASGDRGRTSGT
ncbi:uncharacterized protein [Pempheris klunzingeri]|uniref:uncharacterized protein n=1 Tax=Pempheris klunzingeri TaxID=3127111 RepID=UPI0039815FEB